MGNYAGFAVLVETTAGVPTRVGAGVPVQMRQAGAGGDLGAVYTNANGEIPAGSVAPPAGTKVYFRVENYNGLSASIAQILT
jgi:hypothetical protein